MDFAQSTEAFLTSLDSGEHAFASTLAFIDQWYDATPTAFQNGSINNSANENQGSAKVLGLAFDLKLSQDQVLLCFGEHYRDVLATPDVQNHFNLRRLIKDGLVDIKFETFPLQRRDIKA